MVNLLQKVNVQFHAFAELPIAFPGTYYSSINFHCVKHVHKLVVQRNSIKSHSEKQRINSQQHCKSAKQSDGRGHIAQLVHW